MSERFEIIEHRESGYYGKVFKARQTDLDRVVALKVIKPEHSPLTDVINHAKKLAAIGPHPNIVTVHSIEDVTIEGVKYPAMVMEWIEGETLGKRLGGPVFSMQEARRILAGLFDAVDHMHKCNVAHCDLHLGNVLLLSDCTPKVIDVPTDRNNSLSRLSTLSREGAIVIDTDYCRNHAMMVLRRARISNMVLVELDAALQAADDLDAIRTVCLNALDGKTPIGGKGTLIRPLRILLDSHELQQRVIQCIEDQKPASLQSIMSDQVRNICDELLSDRFDELIKPTPDLAKQRVADFDSLIQPILPAIASLAHWGERQEARIIGQSIETIANVHQPAARRSGSFYELWRLWRAYPPTVLHYVAGLSAWMNERFDTLHHLLYDLTLFDRGSRRNLSTEFGHWRAEASEKWNHFVLDGGSLIMPVSEHLLTICQPAFRSVIIDTEVGFPHQFDQFEYFLGLTEFFNSGRGNVGWGPLGRFVYSRYGRRAPDDSLGEEFAASSARDKNWPGLDAGFFDGDRQKFLQAIAGFDQFIVQVRSQNPRWGL